MIIHLSSFSITMARRLGCQCGGTIGETVHILQVNPVSFLLRED